MGTAGTHAYDGTRTSAKGMVDTVAISNLTLSDTQTVSGLALTDGMVCLCTAQTDGTENGLWVVNADTTWTRPARFTADVRSAANGATVFVRAGTFVGMEWDMITAAVTPGTTDHLWYPNERFVFSNSMDLVANTTTVARCKPVTFPCTIVRQVTDARTAGTSAAGTITIALNAAGNTTLSTATVDLEAQAAVRTVMTPTATGANLVLAVGAVIATSVVSDNADAAAGLDIVTEVWVIPTAP